MKLTDARYARTSGRHSPASRSVDSRGSGSFQWRKSANFGRSARSSSFTGGIVRPASGYRSKYACGA